jgi:sulfite exporter TauE/SafE/copper chaperone CopZ
MSTENQQTSTLTVKVHGMHCVNCQVLVERRFKQIPQVSRVNVDHITGNAEIVHSGTLDVGALQNAVQDDGYTVSAWGEENSGALFKGAKSEYLQIGAAFLIVAGVFFALKEFDFVPRTPGISDNMGYGLVFLIGLVASVSSCMAVTGGLLVALAARYNDANKQLTGTERLQPHIYFNVGRIVSYTLFGGAIGAIGSAMTLSPEINGVLIFLASAVMIVLGLKMLNLFPSLGQFQPTMPKFLAHKIHDLASRGSKKGAFALGASTFFLPCGFTQSLQLYALSKGSITVGALTMLAFALGTLPALFSLSAISSFAQGSFQRYFVKVAGVAVVFLALVNIQYGFVLTGSDFSGGTKSAPLSADMKQEKVSDAKVDEAQIVNMKVVGLDYIPNRFTVKQGVPVEWRIDAKEADGCARVLLAPKLGIRKFLFADLPNTVTFTPQSAGEFSFNCGMGMMTPDSKFTVMPNVKG